MVDDVKFTNILAPVWHVAFMKEPISSPPRCYIGIAAEIIGRVQRRHIKVSLRPSAGCRIVPGPLVDLRPAGSPGVSAGRISDDHAAEWFPCRLIRVLPFRQYPAA